mmetsp:Transcript_83344/g.241157  ORF Transcript_83344/g.241157 Transcript_83344/m.241157 type:complete len:214 (+) Transcript_83344:78-719(+)
MSTMPSFGPEASVASAATMTLSMESGAESPLPKPKRKPPRGRPSLFVAAMECEGDLGNGLIVEAFDISRALFVSSVSTNSCTAVGRYNETAPEDKRIGPGDYIVAVGERTELKEMRSLMEDKAFELVVRRPHLFKVVVPKAGRPIGLGIMYLPDSAAITIKRIDKAGAAYAAGVDLIVGDRLVAVNGRSGSADALLAELRRSTSPELTVSRCG